MYFSQEFINNVIFDCFALRANGDAQGERRCSGQTEMLRANGDAQGKRRCSGQTVYGLTDHATLQSGASEYSHVYVHPEPVEGPKELSSAEMTFFLNNKFFLIDLHRHVLLGI